jgi:nitrate reductase NapAB chaperone NapD
MTESCQISNLIVWVRPGRLAVTRAEIGIMPDMGMPEAKGAAKLLVALKPMDQRQIAERLKAIEALPGVLNVSIVYQNPEADRAETRQDQPVRSAAPRGDVRTKFKPVSSAA